MHELEQKIQSDEETELSYLTLRTKIMVRREQIAYSFFLKNDFGTCLLSNVCNQFGFPVVLIVKCLQSVWVPVRKGPWMARSVDMPARMLFFFFFSSAG